MLAKVKIRNFQSLVDADLELGTLTVIVGQNDVGKSALFRSVRAASEALSGSDFISYGKQQASVTLQVDEYEITWEKGATINRYTVLHPLTNGRAVYDRVGRETPPDVAELLGMSSVSFDKGLELNLNFADQDDPPFLIPFPGGLTSAAVAKILGDLTNLNLLFKAVAEADRMRKRADSAADIRKQDVVTTEQRLIPFENLNQEMADCRKLRKAVVEARSLELSIATLKNLRDKREYFRTKFESLEASRREINYDPQLSDLLNTEVDPLLDTLTRVGRARHDLGGKLARQSMLEQSLAESAKYLAVAQNDYDNLIGTLDECPLCGQPVDHDSFATEHSHA